MLTARDPLQPQHVLWPDRLLPLQRPRPGPQASLRLRLGPGLGFRLQLRLGLGLHARAGGPWSGLRPRPSPAAALLHLHGLAGPPLACCRGGCLRRLEPREGGASAAPPPDGAPGTAPPPGVGQPRAPPTPAERLPARQPGSTPPGLGGASPSFIFFTRYFKEFRLPLLTRCASATLSSRLPLKRVPASGSLPGMLFPQLASSSSLSSNVIRSKPTPPPRPYTQSKVLAPGHHLISLFFPSNALFEISFCSLTLPPKRSVPWNQRSCLRSL